MTSQRATAGGGRVRTLRSRWNRGFAVLVSVVVLSGLAAVIGNRLLVDTFRDAAVRVEREATNSAKLRADIVEDSIALTTVIPEGQSRPPDPLQPSIEDGFRDLRADIHTAAARNLVDGAHEEWLEIVAAAGPADDPADLVTIGAAVSTRAPIVLGLLDSAGSTSREAVRSDLADAAAMNWQTMAVLALFELLAIALTVRLARRLSSEVLQPVSLLRDSARQLARGNLDHRMNIQRADELGELAKSFNAMADAIAGSQRSLTLEASTDSLSGLANRSAFHALRAVLAQPERRQNGQAVLFVDLDDFKDVNDTLGHVAGDQLLCIVAGRLAEAVRPGDLVARLGGDEFALLLNDLPDPDTALTVARRVVTALAEPVKIGDSWTHVGASVGLATRQEDSTLDSLMREADVAMYAAKAKGKNRVESYDAGLDEVAVARHALKADVTGAVARDELLIDYQPVVDLETGIVVGLEALLRWQHPIRGLLPPSDFIALAEESGAILGIGGWVLDGAAHQLRHWQRRPGQADLWISVNVSVCQLNEPGFAEDVERVVTSAGINASSLVLEVTESVVADPSGGAAEALTALRRSGIRVALDDFGTGYSSIGYLRRLPVDILKIDRSFVSGTHPGSPESTLLEGIVALAQRLGLDVIPEGIDALDQLEQLRAMGCRIGQGFLLSRPLSVDAVEAHLAVPLHLPDRLLPEVALVDATA